MHVHHNENKHNEWKIWPKITYLIWWNKLCYKTKTVKNLINGIKHHTYLKLFTCHPCTGCARVRQDLPIRKVKASHNLIFLARGTKFWHARDAHVPLEYAKYKTFQCSSYATMARTSRREGSWNKGRDFTDVRVIKQQNNHINVVKRFKATGATADKTTPCRRKSVRVKKGGKSPEEDNL